MPILRIKKHTDPYVIIDKRFLNCSGLSWAAKGLLTYLLSKPDHWEVNVAHLTECSRDGRHAVSASLKELEKAHYITRGQDRKEQGRFGKIEYLVYEVPNLDEDGGILGDHEPLAENLITVADCLTPRSGFPIADKRQAEKPLADNHILVKNDHNKERSKQRMTAAKEVTLAQDKKQAPIKMPSLKAQDAKIGAALTSTQQIYLAAAVKKIIFEDEEQIYQEVKLCKDIERELLNAQSFKKCDQIFIKKISAIKKTIQSGSWLPAAVPPLEQDEHYKALRYKQQTAYGERERLNKLRMFKESRKDNLTSVEVRALEQANEQCREISLQIEQYAENYHSNFSY